MNQHRMRIVQLIVVVSLLANALPTQAHAAFPAATPREALAQALAAMRQRSAPLPAPRPQPPAVLAAQATTLQPSVPTIPPTNEPIAPVTPSPTVRSIAPEAVNPAQAIPTPNGEVATLIQAKERHRSTLAQRSALYLPLVAHGDDNATTVRITAAGGELRAADGSVTLVVPAGAVAEDVWVTLRQDGERPSVATARSLGVFFELTARTTNGHAVTRFAQPLTLKVRYPVDGSTTGTARALFFFDTERRTWQPLPTSDNEVGTLTATTDHFTQFAVLVPSSGVQLVSTNGLADGRFVVDAVGSDSGMKLNLNNFDTGATIAVERDLDGLFRVNAGAPGNRLGFHFTDSAGSILSFDGYPLTGEHSYWAVAGEGEQPLFVGQNAGSWPLFKLFRDTYARLGGAPVVGPPDSDLVHDWSGFPTQGFKGGNGNSGSVIIYNPDRCAAYQVKGDILDVYLADGGPGATLGPPISSEITAPPTFYASVGEPISYFKHGIITRDIGASNFSIQKYYPQIGNITVSFAPMSPTNQFTGSVQLDVRPVPGNPTSTEKLTLKENAQVGPFTEVAPNQYTVPLKGSFFDSQSINVTLEAERPPDGRIAKVQVQIPLARPNQSFGPFENLPPDPSIASCDPGTTFDPPADTTPPVIGKYAVVQDGKGGMLFAVEVTDDRAVANVTITIDGTSHTATRGKDGLYEIVVRDLSIGTHTFTIAANDTAGNKATPVSDTFKIERSDSYGVLASKGYSKDPVSTAIGNFIYDYTDFNIIVPGLDLELKRFYNGQSSAIGLFGRGWTTLFDMRVVEMDNALLHGAIVRYSDGRTAIFPANGNSFDRAAALFDTLARIGTGYQLIAADQTRYTFDSRGWLVRVEDRNSNALILTYNGDQLTQIASTRGRTVAVTSDPNGRVIQVDGPDSINLIYTYNGDGQLISVTDGTKGTVRYHYDANNSMTRIETPRGDDFLAEHQFDAQGRVSFQRVGDAFINRFSYDDANRTTTITDSFGRTTVHGYDDKGRLVEVTDSLGRTEYYAYNNDDQRISVTDRNGHTTLYDYDAQGNKTQQIDYLGGVTSWAYDGQNNLTSETDALGRITRYEYDPQGRRTAIINALNERTEMRYNAQGQMTEQISPRNARTTFTYDAQGNLIEQQDALGGVTRYQFDAQGRCIKTIDANGNATTSAYDANGNQLTETDALSNTTTYTYDKNNNRPSETNALGATTRYTYSRLGKLLTTTYPDGGVQTITYDDMGNRVAETDQLGHTHTWTLDANYRVISETDALGAVTRYQYDPHGNRTAVTDANGHTTRYEYDELNRVVKMIDPLGGVIRYTYDKVGNRTGEINPLGAITVYEYDKLNRVKREINAQGATTTYEYDPDGNKISVTDALNGVTKYEYDVLNREISVTDALGGMARTSYDAVGNKVKMIDALGHVTRSEYDPANRMTSTTDALGHTTRFLLDAVGNQIAMMDADGAITRSAYDSMSRRVEMVDALGGKSRMEYDLAGRKISETDALGRITRFQYDAVGRQIAVQDAGGFVERMAYDAVGNQISTIDKNGQRTRHEYDPLNRLVAQTDGRNTTTRFVYDRAGNQIARIDANGNTTTYGYDLLNRKVSETNPLGHPTRTEYDLLGRSIRTTFADGATVAKAYDALGRVVAEQDANGFVKRYGYDAVGNQTTSTDASGFVTTTSYDALRRPVRVADNIGTLKETTYDALGNVAAETDGLGQKTRRSYDVLRRPVAVTDSLGHTADMAYDAVGNAIAKTDANGNKMTLAYDARNQLVAETNGLGQTTRYEYDGVGQRTAAISPLGIVTRSEYDQARQLVAVTLNYRSGVTPDQQTNVTTRFAYDAVGNRVSITDPNGHTVTFMPDAAGQLVAETDALGNTTRYEYDQVGRQIKRIDATGATVVSTYDRNGLLVGVAYPNGSGVVRSYDGNRNLITMVDATGTTRLTYDGRNRPTSEETPRGRTAMAYDAADNRVSLRYADGKLVRYAYNTANQLERVTSPDNAVTTYERDGVGQVVRQVNGNGTVTTQQYDAANRVALVETRKGDAGGALIVRVAYTYNAAGQRTEVARSYAPGTLPASTERYTHDPLDRLVGVERSDGVNTNYRYDAAGNRLAWRSNDDPRTAAAFDALDMAYGYDDADQLLRAQNRATNTQTDYRYDANGSRIEQRGPQGNVAYRYDAEHRLIGATRTQGGDKQEIAAMAYDGAGRRVAKAEALGGSALKTTAYLYDGVEPIATYATWGTDYTNLYRAEGGRILQQERMGTGGGSAWLTQDALGSTVALAGDTGTDARALRYDPYGTLTGSAGAGDETAFTFTGQEGDEATGLYHFHARDYDHATATWLTRDPYRGTQDDPQSLHRYGYVKGNPVDLWDAWGYAAQGGTYGKNEFRIIDLINKLTPGWGVMAEYSATESIGWSFDFEANIPKPIGKKIGAELIYQRNVKRGVELALDSKELIGRPEIKVEECVSVGTRIYLEAEIPLQGPLQMNVYGGGGGEVKVCSYLKYDFEKREATRNIWSPGAKIEVFLGVKVYIGSDQNIPGVGVFQGEVGVMAEATYSVLEKEFSYKVGPYATVKLEIGAGPFKAHWEYEKFWSFGAKIKLGDKS